MSTSADHRLAEELRKSANIISETASSPTVIAAVTRAISLSIETLKRGSKLLFAGNGGSAADCQHMAAEYVSRFNFDRPGLAAVALTVDTSAITAIGNDYGFEQLFARQLEAIGRGGDLLFAYSTSGNSTNIITCVQRARSLGIATVGLTGNQGGKMVELCDVCIEVPSGHTPRIQEAHLVLGHAICGLVETRLFGAS